MASNDIRMRVLLNVEGKNTVVEVSSSVKELQGALTAAKSKADTFHNALLRFGAISTISSGLRNGIDGLSAAMQPFIDKANNAAVAQTKLKTVMEQRMKATQGDVASINKLVSAQTELGVVGGTVQRSGLQQLATFASHRKTLETLLPAMNNLLTQQKGLNATSEDAVGIANLMGKALMGSASALKRVGVTLTPAQEEMIKYGDESQRAAALAQAITDNVGSMNKELAKTGAGHVKQMANEFGSLQVKVGQFFGQYQNIISGAGQMGMAVSGITSLVSAVRGLWTAFGLATVASTALSAGQRVLATVTSACATASRVYRVSLVEFAAAEQLAGKSALAAAVSTTAFKVAVRGLMIATGVGAAIALLSVGIEALVNWLSESGSAGKEAASGLKTVSSAATETSEALDRQRSDSLGPLLSKYQELQAKWEKLTSDKQRLKFISDQSEAFESLGVKIGSVKDAESFLVDNTDSVRKALYARAEAAAAAAVAADNMKKALQLESSATQTANNAVLFDFDKKHWSFKPGTPVMSEADKKRRKKLQDGLESGRLVAHTPTADRMRARAKALREESQKMLDLQNKDEERSRRGLSRWQGTQYHSPGTTHTPKKNASSVKQGDTLIKDPKSIWDWRNNAKYYSDAMEKCDASDKKRMESLRVLRNEAQKTADSLSFVAENGKLPAFDPNAIPRIDWRDAGDKMETGKSGMRSDVISTWRDMKQEELANTDLGTKEGMAAGVKIVADMDSMDTLQQAVENALSQGVTLPTDAVQGLYDSIFNSEDIPTDQLQSWVDSVNAELEKAGLGKIALKVDGKGTKKIVEGGKEAKGSWKDAARAVQSVGGALAGIEDPAVKVAGTIAQAIAEIALSFAGALNKKESQAGGVWGWIAAAAAGTATMISTIAAVKGATRHAGGGIVGGNTPSGDLQPVLLNSGELILNKAQQGAIASQMQESRESEGSRAPYVNGEAIYLGLSNYLRRRGYGEIVTTRR